MEYIEVEFTIQPKQPATDILVTSLCELGFDSFVETEGGTYAYIPLHLFSENDLKQERLFSDPDYKITYVIREIAAQNWNSEWEKNFEPVVINDSCMVRAPFHDLPKGVIYDIVIEPKMSFGTGHHETTFLMANKMLGENFEGIKNKAVLDMGCGTGILAILAAKMGAGEISAIDFDEWAYTNACENILINNCPEVKVQLGNADSLQGKNFDTILANINRNILLNDMSKYCNALNENGNLLMSGFFTTDSQVIKDKALSLGFTFCGEAAKNNWSVLHFILT